MVGGNPLHDAYGFRFWNRMYHTLGFGHPREPDVFLHSLQSTWCSLRRIHLLSISWSFCGISCLPHPSGLCNCRYHRYWFFGCHSLICLTRARVCCANCWWSRHAAKDTTTSFPWRILPPHHLLRRRRFVCWHRCPIFRSELTECPFKCQAWCRLVSVCHCDGKDAHTSTASYRQCVDLDYRIFRRKQLYFLCQSGVIRVSIRR